MSNLKMPTMTFEAIADRFFSRRGDATRTIAYATTATFVTDGVHVEYLIRHHGNPIAWVAEKEVAVSNAGYGTPTTRARINAVLASNGLPFHVGQRNHRQVLSDSHFNPITDEFKSAVFDLTTHSLTAVNDHTL